MHSCRGLLLVLVIAGTLAIAGNAKAGCYNKSNTEIGSIFDKAIMLHEQFRQSIGHKQYGRLRERDEQYQEDILLPCVRYVSTLLPPQITPLLIHKLMTVTVSYEDSADEEFALSLGRLFSTDPNAIEHEIKQFSPSERALIANQVYFGWMNIKNKIDNSIIADRERRLKQLALSVKSK
jgi:hypothetical protein